MVNVNKIKKDKKRIKYVVSQGSGLSRCIGSYSFYFVHTRSM